MSINYRNISDYPAHCEQDIGSKSTVPEAKKRDAKGCVSTENGIFFNI